MVVGSSSSFRIEYFLVIKGYNPQLGEKAPPLENYYYRLAAARILFLDSLIP